MDKYASILASIVKPLNFIMSSSQWSPLK